jgi:Tfp pilus assembly protein PilN
MKAVNLLPAGSKPTKRSDGAKRPSTPGRPLPIGALAVLGVLAALVIAVVALSLVGNRVREHEGRLASLKAQEKTAAAEIARLEAYGTFRQLAVDRVSTVRQLASSRFDWERALRDVSRAIPADVTLDALTGTVAPSARTGGGSSANPLRASRTAPAIELAGCTRDHDSVARLMARLRAVRGVTRVSLATSAKEDTLPAAAGTTGTDVVEVGCGAGSKPKFQLVTFFEASAGAVASPAGTATTPVASPTPAPGATATPAAGSTPAPASSPSAGSTPSPPAGQGASG